MTGHRLLRRDFLRTGLAASVAAALPRASRAQSVEKVTYGTNWVAQAEHGGFYQAVADGTYRKYGLDVTIVAGGPQINNRLLLAVGKLDFYMGANLLHAFDAVEKKIPTVVVAAIFQKDPQVLLAHPGVGVETFDDLKKLTILVSSEGMATYYQWLKSEHGFTDAQVRPYTFNPQPFLANKNSAMQGYVTSEPYIVEKIGGFRPKIFLLADQGFDTYSTTIETRLELVEKRPDLVQRFVDASVVGWYNYLYGNNAAANRLIKDANPEMTDDLIAHSIRAMKEHGIVDSGDALTLGIGVITEARVKSFFDKMVRASVVQAGVDWRRAIDTRFTGKKVGLELRPPKK
jgi:NitT/TauT family transport system substrate-binding protein